MTLQVLHRLEFDAEYLMSGVIVQSASARQEEPLIFLKGSLHSVIQLVAHNRLPGDWAHVTPPSHPPPFTPPPSPPPLVSHNWDWAHVWAHMLRT